MGVVDVVDVTTALVQVQTGYQCFERFLLRLVRLRAVHA